MPVISAIVSRKQKSWPDPGGAGVRPSGHLRGNDQRNPWAGIGKDHNGDACVCSPMSSSGQPYKPAELQDRLHPRLVGSTTITGIIWRQLLLRVVQNYSPCGCSKNTGTLMIQLALITGGAVPFGKAIAMSLAKSKYSVAIHYNRFKEEAVDLVSAITKMGGRAECFGASLAKHEEVEGLIPQISRAMGPLTCLVNNASHFVDDRLPALSAESLAQAYGGQSRSSGFSRASLRGAAPKRRKWQHYQSHRSAGAASKPLFLFVHAQRIRRFGQPPEPWRRHSRHKSA